MDTIEPSLTELIDDIDLISTTSKYIDSPHTLVLVLDTNLASWNRIYQESTQEALSSILDALMFTCCAFQNLSENSRLVIIGISGNSRERPQEATFLYKQRGPGGTDSSFQVREALASLISQKHDTSSTNALAKGLIMALAFIYRNCNHGSIRSKISQNRLLILQASQEDPKNYISTMQGIFYAQKHSIVIDTCRFNTSPEKDGNCLLQTMSKLTGGSFTRISNYQDLFPTLLFTYITEPGSEFRPKSSTIQWYPTACCCYCHKKPINIGHVCSICFAVYCQFIPVCRHCRTKFDIPVATHNIR
jgi:hypothetical protein